MIKVLLLALSIISLVTNGYAATSNILNVGNAGMNGTDVALTSQFTFSGLGTVSSDNKYCRRVGDKFECEGTVVQGTAAGTASIDFSSYTFPSAKMAGANQVVGYWWRAIDSATNDLYVSAGRAGVIFYDGSDTNSLFFAYQTSTGGLIKITGGVVNNTNTIAYKFSVPITGWTTGGSAASSICHFRVNMASGSPVESSDPTSCVASYADNGTGQFTATFTTAYTSSTSFNCSATESSAGTDRAVNIDARTSSTITIDGLVSSTGSLTDDYEVDVLCTGT